MLNSNQEISSVSLSYVNILNNFHNCDSFSSVTYVYELCS